MTGLGEALGAELLERGVRLAEAGEPHARENRGCLRELDLTVVHDLQEVPPRVAQVE